MADYRVDYPACFTVDDGTVESIRALRSTGWKLGIITNGASFQLDKLTATNLIDEFDAICISENVGASKPEVAIFEEAARRCGEPLAGWMVGDSLHADIEGGRRAGLRTIWMARGRTRLRENPVPDAIVATIPEAVDIMLGEVSLHAP